MAAPKGNEFWTMRSKHGRDKLFTNAKLLWDAACEYFQWCVDHPLISIEYYGKDAERCEVPKMRPFTMHGVCLYLDCNRGYFNDFKAAISEKKDVVSKDFSVVITRIEETVYKQKFEGAAAGFLNANLISRDLGLSDKRELSGEIALPAINVQVKDADAAHKINDLGTPHK